LFFLPSTRKGISVVGILSVLFFGWLFTEFPDLLERHAKGDSVVEVPALMQSCEAHEECAAVETACSSCCRYKPINKSYTERYYTEELNPICEKYSGAVCDCLPEASTPLCVNSKCILQASQPVYNE
jgi:hypothetical protein